MYMEINRKGGIYAIAIFNFCMKVCVDIAAPLRLNLLSDEKDL